MGNISNLSFYVDDDEEIEIENENETPEKVKLDFAGTPDALKNLDKTGLVGRPRFSFVTPCAKKPIKSKKSKKRKMPMERDDDDEKSLVGAPPLKRKKEN